VALIPGLLQAYRNVNIIISGLMMNFIATYGVSFLIKKIKFVYMSTKSSTKSIPTENILPKAGLDKLFPVGGTGASGANIGILIAIGIGILIYFLLNRTTFGFELRTCGANRYAAKNAGIKENKSIVISMFIAGALAGIGGGLVYLSSSGINLGISDSVNGTGFYGIAVALLGQLNPIGIVAAGLLVSYFQVGGSSLQIYGFSAEIIDVIVAAIIFSCAFAQRLGGVFRAAVHRYNSKREPSQVEEASAVAEPAQVTEAAAENAQVPETENNDA
jgi:simple sugar transport system permease protein